jgi:hypothetical protein
MDTLQNARAAVLESVQSAESITPSMVSLVMSEMGRKGGQIGGKRRLETMTKAERRKVAANAARARWKKAKKPPP